MVFETPELLELEKESRLRVHSLCGINQTIHPRIIQNLQKYGLGSQRTRLQFEKKANINFKNQTVNDQWGGHGEIHFEETRKNKQLLEVLSLLQTVNLQNMAGEAGEISNKSKTKESCYEFCKKNK